MYIKNKITCVGSRAKTTRERRGVLRAIRRHEDDDDDDDDSFYGAKLP